MEFLKKIFSIYVDKLVPLPSMFFIGKNGTPLEIVTGITKTVEELVAKIDGVLEKANLIPISNNASASANLIESKLKDFLNFDFFTFSMLRQVNVPILKMMILKSCVRVTFATNEQKKKQPHLPMNHHHQEITHLRKQIPIKQTQLKK